MKRGADRNVYVKGIERGISQNELYAAFSSFGKIKSMKLVENRYPSKPNFAYILFDSQESAQRAIAEGGNLQLGGSDLAVKSYMQESPIEQIKGLINEVSDFGKRFSEMLSQSSAEVTENPTEELDPDDVVECSKRIKQKLTKLPVEVRKKCKNFLDYKVDVENLWEIATKDRAFEEFVQQATDN